MREEVRLGAKEKSELVTVYKAMGYNEANIVKGLLEANGIKCLLTGNAAPSVDVFTVNGMGEVRITVAGKDADAAVKLIEETGG